MSASTFLCASLDIEIIRFIYQLLYLHCVFFYPRPYILSGVYSAYPWYDSILDPRSSRSESGAASFSK